MTQEKQLEKDVLIVRRCLLI